MSTQIAASLAAAAVFLAAPSAAGAAEPDVVPGQLLVRFDPGVGKAESKAIVADQGGRVIERFGIVPRLALVDLPPGLGVEAAERRFERLGEVTSAQPNRIYREADVTTPNDPFFISDPNALWGLDNTGQMVPSDSVLEPTLTGPAAPPDPPFPLELPAPPRTADADIDAPEAWFTETGVPDVTVGVIDSGITVGHEDLDGNLWTNPGETPGDMIDDDANGIDDDVNGADFVENDGTPDDASGHGSHVAGAIGAEGNNMLGITGAAWDVSIAGLKAGSADGRLYSDTIIAAIGYADDKAIPIVNGSYIGGGTDDPDDPMNFERIAYANADETLFVVAAGNAASDVDNTVGTAAFPCAYSLPNILCVAATTPSDGLASFSNFGDTNVDVGAPGTYALSTEPTFGAPVFEDDFEDETLDQWVVDSGTWFNDDEGPKLDDRALTDSPGGNYDNSEDSSIRLATPIDLSGKDSCRLRTASAFTLASGDSLRAEFTTDPTPGPMSAWTPLYKFTTPFVGNGVFAFRSLDMDLKDATGEASVTVRFRLDTNLFGTADGVHLDDIKIECVDPTPGAQNGYRVRQGTSMASPQVAGVAALVLSNDPLHDLTVEELRNTLLASTDPLAALKCKTFTGGRINAATALSIDPATATPPPAPDCSTPGAPFQPPVSNPPIVQDTPVEKPEKPKKAKCKKPKKGASVKAKKRAKKKCKQLRKKQRAKARKKKS